MFPLFACELEGPNPFLPEAISLHRESQRCSALARFVTSYDNLFNYAANLRRTIGIRLTNIHLYRVLRI